MCDVINLNAFMLLKCPRSLGWLAFEARDLGTQSKARGWSFCWSDTRVAIRPSEHAARIRSSFCIIQMCNACKGRNGDFNYPQYSNTAVCLRISTHIRLRQIEGEWDVCMCVVSCEQIQTLVSCHRHFSSAAIALAYKLIVRGSARVNCMRRWF